jgi:hypothetical protein
MPRIVKAKAQKRAAHGIKSEGPKIQSAGFQPVAKASKIARVKIDKSALAPLPRRDIFTGEPIT